MQKTEDDPYFTRYTKINSKWIKDLNLTPKTIKHRGNFSTHWFWQCFLGYDTKSRGNKAKIDKWDYIKHKNVCASKETVNRIKW